MFSAELELATSGLHLRCTQRLAMLPASLAPHVRQQTKQKKILKNKKFLRLSYIRKVISSFGNNYDRQVSLKRPSTGHSRVQPPMRPMSALQGQLISFVQLFVFFLFV